MKSISLITILFFFMLPVSAQNDNAAKNTELELKKLSEDWMTAVMKRDEKILNKIVAPEFTLGGTAFEKPVITREVWMKNTLENLKIDSANYLKIFVELKANIAIVQSVFYWSVKFRDYPTKKDTLNLIDTWMKRNGEWQVVSRIVVEK